MKWIYRVGYLHLWRAQPESKLWVFCHVVAQAPAQPNHII